MAECIYSIQEYRKKRVWLQVHIVILLFGWRKQLAAQHSHYSMQLFHISKDGRYCYTILLLTCKKGMQQINNKQ